MFKIKLWMIGLFMGLFVFAEASNVLACLCNGAISICGIYTDSDAIVIGKIENIESANVTEYRENMVGQKVKVRVTKSFKGKNQEFITLAQPNTSCDAQFDEEDKEKEYLFYLELNKKTNFYKVMICGRSDETKNSSDDLSWLKGLPKSLKRNRLSGVIKLYEDNSRFTFVDYLVETKIKVSGEKKSFDLYTDINGMFEVWDLPSGKYNVKAELPENTKFYFGMTSGLVERQDSGDYIIEMKEKGCAGLDYILKTVK